MEIILCAQCGCENSSDRKSCMKCGATLISKSFWDINGDGKLDFDDVKAAAQRIGDETMNIASSVATHVKKVFQSKSDKDQDAINNLKDSFENQPKDETNAPQQQFKNTLKTTIDLKISERLAEKNDGERYLNYSDAQILTTSVHNIFTGILLFTPRQVSAACALSKTVLAPSAKEKQNLIKAAIGFAGGTTGMSMIIAAVGSALGWGAGIIASVTAVFVGSSITGPIMWGVGGLGLVAVSAYFATTSDKELDTERFIHVLQGSLEKAVEAIWDEHGAKLTKAIDEINL